MVEALSYVRCAGFEELHLGMPKLDQAKPTGSARTRRALLTHSLARSYCFDTAASMRYGGMV